MTPQGRGGVATICFHGDLSLLDDVTNHPPAFRSARGGRCADLPLQDVVFGRWGEEHQEEVVVCRVAEAVTEIHCHGGRVAVERILGDLRSRGCEITTWVEHIEQNKTTLEAECFQALTQATTLRTATHLLAQQQGALANRLLELFALEGDALRNALNDLLRWSEFGLHLTTPWSVVLCGRPNVGKSSLINALVGYRRAIVYDQPGTTRDVVQAETALDGWPIQFSDTAGLREGAEELEQLGIAKAREQIKSADLLIIVIDGTQPITDDDRNLLAEHPDALVLMSKADLPPHDGTSEFVMSHPEVLRVSAMEKTGMDELQQAIVHRLVPRPPDVSTPLPFTSRQVECLRTAAGSDSVEDVRRLLRQFLGDRG